MEESGWYFEFKEERQLEKAMDRCVSEFKIEWYRIGSKAALVIATPMQVGGTGAIVEVYGGSPSRKVCIDVETCPACNKKAAVEKSKKGQCQSCHVLLEWTPKTDPNRWTRLERVS